MRYKSKQICFKCGGPTEQLFEQTSNPPGSALRCSECESITHKWTLEDMARVMQEKFSSLKTDHTPPETDPVPVVHIKHNATGGVSEVGKSFVLQHYKIKGEWPTPGSQIFTLKHGIPVPFGEVVKVD